MVNHASNKRPAVVFGYEGRTKSNGGNYDPKAFEDLIFRLKSNGRQQVLNHGVIEIVDTTTFGDYTFDFLERDLQHVRQPNNGGGNDTNVGSRTAGDNHGSDSSSEIVSNIVVPNMIRDNEEAFAAALQASTGIVAATVDLRSPPPPPPRGTSGQQEETAADEHLRISEFVARSLGGLTSLRDLTVHVYCANFRTLVLLLRHIRQLNSLTVYANNHHHYQHERTDAVRRRQDLAENINDDGDDDDHHDGTNRNDGDDGSRHDNGVEEEVEEEDGNAGDDNDLVVQALKGHPSLESLAVHGDDVTLFRSFTEAIPAMRMLKSIDLSYDGGRPDTMLRIQDLSTICFGSSTVQQITLTDFSFSSRHNYVIAEALTAGKNPALKQLKIYGYQTHHTVAENCELICGKLAANTTLEKFQFPVPADDGVRLCRAAGEALRINTCLTELTLDGGEICCEAFTEICSAVAENKTLRRLKLEGCEVTSQTAVKAVSTLLSRNVTLVELDLEFVDLLVCSDALVACICSLRKKSVLKRLDVVGRPVFIEYEKPILSLPQSRAILKSIQRNFSLTHCSKFRIRRSSSKGEKKSDRDHIRANIAATLKLNRCGRRYLLEEEGASKTRGLRVLSLVSNDVDSIFTHLLENPSLCDRRPWARTRKNRAGCGRKMSKEKKKKRTRKMQAGTAKGNAGNKPA